MGTIIEAFLLIFTAELGDKSMLLAMTFATRFPLPPVLAGIFLGILANHGLAVLVGSQAGRLLPAAIVHPLSGILFLVFAFTGLRFQDAEEEEQRASRHIWLACALTFFIGEFGDKTQITAMTLASSQPALPVLAGTVTAMLCTSLLSIWIGARIGKKIPERRMRILSGLVFLAVGILRLSGVISRPIWLAAAAVAIGTYLYLAQRLHRAGVPGMTRLQARAEALKRQRELLEKATRSMCLGQEKCGTCAGAACMVGYAKRLLQVDADENLDADITGLLRKEYPMDTVREGLAIILRFYALYGWNSDRGSSQHSLRAIFETILFGETLQAGSLAEYFTLIQAKDPTANWQDLQNTL